MSSTSNPYLSIQPLDFQKTQAPDQNLYPSLDAPENYAPSMNYQPSRHQGANHHQYIPASNQLQNQLQSSNQNPNLFMRIPHQNPFGYRNPHPPTQYQLPQSNNFGKNDTQNKIQKVLLINQLSNNLSASGQGLVLCLALISTVLGGIFFCYYTIVNSARDYFANSKDLFYILSGYKVEPEESFFTLIIGSLGDKCLTFLAGIISLPILSFAFSGFNFLAMLFACCGATCMAYLQGFFTIVWSLVAISEASSDCSGVNGFVMKFGNVYPTPSWYFYAVMAICSLSSTITNCYWSSNKIRVNKEKRNLTLMAAMV